MSKAVSNVPLSKDALLKSYRKRLRDDIGSMTANFMEIIKLCKTEDETQVARATQSEEDAFEMQVRASNMARILSFMASISIVLSHLSQYFEQVRAGESLMKLISDIKQYLILNDFPSVNEAIAANSKMFLGLQTSADCRYLNSEAYKR